VRNDKTHAIGAEAKQRRRPPSLKLRRINAGDGNRPPHFLAYPAACLHKQTAGRQAKVRAGAGKCLREKRKATPEYPQDKNSGAIYKKWIPAFAGMTPRIFWRK